MISIRKSVDDLSRLEEVVKDQEPSSAILNCYALAVSSTARYAVEVDTGLLVEFRSHLKVIEDQIRAAPSSDQLRSAQSSFRGELREYRDKSAEHLKKMRQQIEDANAAMSTLASSLAFNGVNHEQEVTSQLCTLESTAKSNNIEEVRGGIGAAVSGIKSSIEQIQRENKLILVQMEDEIRVLHRQIEQERKVLYTDHASGAWNRQKMNTYLDNLFRQNQPFCLVLVWVRNLKRLETQHSRTVVEGTLKALTARFAAIVGEQGVIGRWTEDQFVAVLDANPGTGETASRLSGGYAIQENGLSQKVTLQVSAGIIDRSPGADTTTFHQKLDQLAAAISGA